MSIQDDLRKRLGVTDEQITISGIYDDARPPLDIRNDDGEPIVFTSCGLNWEKMSPEARETFAELIRATYRYAQTHPEAFRATVKNGGKYENIAKNAEKTGKMAEKWGSAPDEDLDEITRHGHAMIDYADSLPDEPDICECCGEQLQQPISFQRQNDVQKVEQ